MAATPTMDIKRSRSLSNLQGNGDAPDADTSQAGLRRVASLPGHRLTRIAEEEDHAASTAHGTSTIITGPGARGRPLATRSRLRRIASKPSRIFRTYSGAGQAEKGEDAYSGGLQGDRVARRPSMSRLRRIASMPGRSLRRMASQPVVQARDGGLSEEKGIVRMKSWSGNVRTGPSKWFERLVSAFLLCTAPWSKKDHAG